jgi:hypothetical protein
MNLKYIHHIHLPSLFHLSPHAGTHPWIGPILPSCPSFFKYILIAQEDFALVFHKCIYCTLTQLTPSVTISLLPCSPIIQHLTVHYVILSSYTNALCFNILLYFSLFLSCLPIIPSDRPTITIIHTHIHIRYTFIL